MRYFYDTEFLEDGHTIELISIGIVCDDGREYYAVNSDMPKDRIRQDDWLCQNVVPHLPLRGGQPSMSGGTWIWALDTRDVHVKPKWVIANEVRDFLTGHLGALEDRAYADDELPELWAYYGAYDHIALMQLWGRMINHPRLIPMWTHDLMQEITRHPGFQKPTQDGDLHNALADARWNRRAFQALETYGAVPE